ncbi:MAG: hypothetical protein HZA34_01780 [Candidatus Pacebacteria bacterium]|nr:hypothetical protein [Candidatus Paceibacterota bacterium]
MITLLHGDNTVASRTALHALLASLRDKQVHIRHLLAKDIDIPSLESALGTTSLFASDHCVVIEELMSLPKSKKKDSIISFIQSSNATVVMWEKKTLTPTQLRQFPVAQTQIFKTSSAVFAWLDTLDPRNNAKMLVLFDKAVKQDGVELCFSMLARQIRLLIQIKEGRIPPISPFAVAKLQKQAKNFTLSHLLFLHHGIVHVDEQQKTSSSPLALHESLTLLLLNM